MVKNEGKDQDRVVDFTAMVVLVILSASWGLNQVSIKVAIQGVSPIFQAGLRSIIATLLIWLWMTLRREPLWKKDGTLLWGVVIGVLFSAEFILIYWGMRYTNASRAVVFLYLTPFIVLVELQLFVPGDRLTLLQTLGLIGAFIGIVFAFRESLEFSGSQMLIGDAMLICAAFFWASTTVTIKATRLSRISPARVLFYQLGVSALILPIASFVMGESGFGEVTPLIIGCIIYQGVWVAFVTYLAWFWLIRHYFVSRISSFTFLTPIFGVIAGAILLDEIVTSSLLLALALVSIGIYLVNRPQPA